MEVEEFKAKHAREITSLKHEIGLAKEKFEVEMNGIRKTAEIEVAKQRLEAEKEINKTREDARNEIMEQIKDALNTKAGSATELLNIILQKIPTYRSAREEKVGDRTDIQIEHKISKSKKKK